MLTVASLTPSLPWHVYVSALSVPTFPWVTPLGRSEVSSAFLVVVTVRTAPLALAECRHTLLPEGRWHSSRPGHMPGPLTSNMSHRQLFVPSLLWGLG